MGKPLITQRRGKGSPTFQAPHHRFKAEVHYRYVGKNEKDKITGEIIDFVDDPARSTLLMVIRYEDGKKLMLPAYEGARVGDEIEEGYNASKTIGSILPLEKIPEGFPIYNVEIEFADGGSIARSSGVICFIVSKEGDNILVKLPSGKVKTLNKRCRATIGNASGGGRTTKPMLKASTQMYKRKARGQLWPIVRGVHMNAHEHPYGGKQHHGSVLMKGKGGSPGQHVGSFGASRTGRRKRK
jgi:large subunit ribosomal protein L2